MYLSKKTTKTIGRYVELSGHIVLIAAAAVGILAIPLALAAADSKNKKKSQHNHGHQSSYQPTTVVNNYHTTNTYFFGNPFDYGSRYTAATVSPREFINGLFLRSLVSSAIGIALSLYLGVPWVAGLVGGLWMAGIGLSILGQYIVEYADHTIEEMRAVQQPPNGYDYSIPQAKVVPQPSAPPLEELEPGIPLSYQYIFRS